MAKATSKTTTGLEFLLSPQEPRGTLLAVSGDDGFLKREVIAAFRALLCGEGDAALDWHAFEGAQTEWRDVSDAVASRSLFGGGGKPVAMIDDADTFVTRHRDELEAFASKAAAGVVVLDVKSLPGNTRLAKRSPPTVLRSIAKRPTAGRPSPSTAVTRPSGSPSVLARSTKLASRRRRSMCSSICCR